MSPLRGFGLIDVIVGTALFLVIFMSLFGVLRTSLSLSSLAKAKAAAVELASTQMEYLRGLSYSNLGTVGGIPSGVVPQYATSTVDGVTYVTRTFVEYYDDPADGLGINDTNGVTTDYKIARVTVSYTLAGLVRSAYLVSNFAPPSIESSTGGGTLSLHVVDAGGIGVNGASVHIVNASTSPAVDFSTFTNTDGYAIIGGAATSSEYQVYVSKSGYSSAQTYPRTTQNANPTPGYLTVVQDQTTANTFVIDLLASLTLDSFSPAVTTSFSDSFPDATNLSSQTNTQVASGAIMLATNELSGSARSISLSPSYLDGWGILSADLNTPSGTAATVQVTDGSGTLVPDSMLPGNSSGFSTFPVSLTNVPAATYPTLALKANLTSNSTTTTSSVLDWSLSHTSGPDPLPNQGFTLTGTKTIGTTASSTPIYKTVVNDSTGASASKTESLEWDSYSLAIGSGTLIESCPSSPYALTPGSATTTALIVGTPSTNTLPVIVQSDSNALIPNATVVLATSGYAATIKTSACGYAYFNGLTAGTYSATASAPGYTTTTVSNISVSGHTATTTISFP